MPQQAPRSRTMMVFPLRTQRTYSAGTLIVEEANTDRTFVTTGQAVLKFLTPDATFAASWSLKSPPSTDDPGRVPVRG